MQSFFKYVCYNLIDIPLHSGTTSDFSEQELLQSADRSKSHIIRVIEGFETVMFRSKFDSWPQTTNVTVSEDGRGKVAGKFMNILQMLLPCRYEIFQRLELLYFLIFIV